YRIKKIWTGDIDTEVGKSMAACNPDGPLSGVVTNVTTDKHAGNVSTVRLFSGTIKEGQEIYNVNRKDTARIQQVGVYAGPRRVQMGSIPVGNIIAVTGIGTASSGDTITDLEHKDTAAFEGIQHVFEPVVTKSIEVKNIKDLPKLIDVLKQRSKEDPTIHISISEDTGETLVSALGELHIEAKIERFIKERGIDIVVSKPIVIYKEGVLKESLEFEGKSPNKHNKFFIKVQPTDPKIIEVLLSGEIPQGKLRKQDITDVASKLADAGMDRDEAKKILYVTHGNMLVNLTRGIVQLNEVIELVMAGFQQVMDQGPLANEPGFGIKIMLMDAKLHEDAIHRGPAQVYPAVRSAIKNAMLDGGASIYEPKQVLRIDSPIDAMGNVTKEIQNRRGQIMDMTEELGMTIITAKLPVAEMFGFEAGLKSATGGRGFQALVDVVYEKLPNDLQQKTVLAIRKRKGMKEEMPHVEQEQ
ncbi:MAG: intein-containing elongation factor EF-2, partial [Candidatus Aenigmarchaeota archaeon]|nr:intein-containing elongation factor EF-2 [Candidatus Aenigmarchaeota archaeon]